MESSRFSIPFAPLRGTIVFYIINNKTNITTMEKFTVPNRAQVAPANQANFDALQKALGMVPNL
jgi:hypothetical protein